MRTSFRKLLGTGLTAVFFAALLPSASAATMAGSIAPTAPRAASGCSGTTSRGGRAEAIRVLKSGPSARSHSMETVSLRTLYIEVKVPKKKVRIGEIVKLPVEVTRPADEDPVGMGIPTPRPHTMPAEEVNVGVGLIVNDVFLPGFARTDENGKATVSIRIERWARPGTVNATFYAWKILADAPCFRVEEFGFKPLPGAFKVTR